MTEVYLALGANIGDARQNIAQAIKLLAESVHDIKQAPIYTSRAVGPIKQADFLNTALRAQTNLKPVALLAFVKEVEQQVGRVKRERWGPREIDIDIIFYGDVLVEAEGLTIPHPSFRNRDFVLQPLIDLNPTLVDPVSHKTIQQLLDKFPPTQKSLILDD